MIYADVINRIPPATQGCVALRMRTKEAAMLQVSAQIYAGTPVAAKPNPDGTWTVYIEGMHTIQRVCDEADVTKSGT